MVAPEVQGIDLFKIAGRSISGWVPSLKTGTVIRQPFCSQLEERFMLWLEYHPLVASYARGDIGPEFATKYRLPIPQYAPFAIGYTFENTPHHYLPDFVGTLADGTPFLAEAGMEDDKRKDRNLVKAEAARRLASLQQGTFWIGTERTLTKRRRYNLVFLHARRKTFPAFADIAETLQEVWPWGEMAPVSEVASRLSHQFPIDLVEAAIWKVVADAAAAGHLLLDLEQYTLSRTLPLALLPPDAPVLVPSPLPDTLLPEPEATKAPTSLPLPSPLIAGPTFDASTLPEPQREQFHRNLRAVEQVLAGATQSSVAEKEGIPRSTLSRLVSRTRERGQIACVPHGSYRRATSLHPAFQECVRRLFGLPTRLTMTAIREHTEMQQVAARLSKETGTPVSLPSYKQVRTAVQRLKLDPDLMAMREGAKSVARPRESAESFVLSIPAPALFTQVDEHTMACMLSPLLVRRWRAVCMRRCSSVSKRQRSSARFWPWGHSRKRTICAWLRSVWRGKITWLASMAVSIPGRVTANLRLSFMIEGRSSPLNVRDKCWWIAWGLSPSKPPRTRHLQKERSNHFFGG
jgi:transposase